MSVKLIALDLDGTTLNKQGHLSLGNKNALLEAIKRDVLVVIATGRCFAALPREIFDVSGLQYVITSNGAKIRDLRTDKTIYSNCINSRAVIEAEKILRDNSSLVEIFVDGRAYIEASTYESVKNGELTYRHSQYVLTTRNPVPDLMAFLLENKDNIENINIFFKSMDDKAAMKPILDTLDNVTLTTSLDNNWEIGGATTSKANALAELCRSLDIKKSEIMACGDSPNDKSMLDEAGIPVAVGNAKEIIKKAAVYISASNNDDGVAEAVKKFVLSK